MDDDINEDALETVEQEMPPSHAVLMAAVEWREARVAAITECNASGTFKPGMIERLADAEYDLIGAVVAYEEWRRDPPKLGAFPSTHQSG